MDTLPFSCLTPEVRRLITFHRIPLSNDGKISITNSPAKLAKAGFLRPENAKNDEVVCEICLITYCNWEGESPFAVHRVLNERCPFLTTPSADDTIQNHPLVVDARNRWFPTSNDSDSSSNDSGYDSRLEDSQLSPDQSYVSVLSDEASFSFPFQPKVGGASMLFASRRLKTFTDHGCKLCIRWADEGFIFRSDSGDVQCVFCAIVLSFDSFEVQRLHAENSALCPCVLKKDVGNITRKDEELIRLKNLRRQQKNKDLQRSYAVCHPQFEDETDRLGTFENWPHDSWDEQLQPSAVCEAGFYFTGCADKVKCYCCGVGLHKWKQGSNPWEQHALHMPACPLVQAKGHNFAQLAAEVPVLTEAELPPGVNCQDTVLTPGQLLTSAPGSLTMDMAAVTAALTTSRFPTKDILIGQLRANDANFSDLCKQRDLNLQKDTELQQTHTQLQQTHTVVEQQSQELQHKDEELQHNREELQHNREELQHKDEELQHNREELQHKDEELQLHREMVRNQEAELRRQTAQLERKRRLMAYQELQISSLQIQMQALLAERRQARQGAAPLQAPQNAAAAAVAAEQNSPLMCDVRCKVCLSAESNTIFQPCHHITCCKTCAQQLVEEFCPVCRAPITSVLPAYIS